MSESKTNFFGSPIVLGLTLLAAVAVFRAPEIIKAMKPGVAPAPVVPTPGPGPLFTLEQRVEQAIGSNPDMALRYAALYATAMGVVADTGRTPKQIQEEISRANKLLGLQGGEAFREVVRSELAPYGGAHPDRSQWAASVGRLSKACKGAAQ